MKHFTLLFLIFASASLMGQSTIESVPNQKLINGSYVSNPDHILRHETVIQIDSILKSVEEKQSVQVSVVVVKSIGDEDAFEFAQTLFNSWGIGKNDNGLLILFVEDIHTIRFHTGYGIEGVLPDVVCKRIQREYMVPEFKRGNYDAGMIAGIMEVQRILSDPRAAEELSTTDEESLSDWAGFVIFLSITFLPAVLVAFIIKSSRGKFKDSKTSDDTPYPEMRQTKLGWIAEFLVIPVLIVTLFGTSGAGNPLGWSIISLYLYFLATLFHRLWRTQRVINRFLKIQDYYEIVELLRKHQWYWFFMAFLFPVPFVLYFPYHLFRKRLYRNHPRKCKECDGAMRKLSENKEDEFLTEGQKTEETLRSVDYDVWQCTECKSIEMWFYLNSSSKYQPCPKCSTIAYHFISRRTVVSATYSSSGKGEEVHGCKFCGYQKKSSYTIARLERSTTSGSSSSFGGSSSSSSGGSWGGGRSGGGGASSSW